MNDLRISTELAIEVLGKDISQVQVIGNTLNYIIPNVESQEDDDLVYIDLGMNINIYEFAYKCKEWIINKEYHINTSEDSINNYIYLYKMVKNNLGYEIDKGNGVQFDSKGYINNLFEACNWILKEL